MQTWNAAKAAQPIMPRKPKKADVKNSLNHPYIVNSLLKDNYFDHKIEDKEKVAEKMKIRWVHLFFK